MQTLTENIFELAPPGGLFNETVISNLFPESSPGARALFVNRACRAGEIIRLKPGLFILERLYRKSEPHPFVLAGLLHSPSYVSLESALSWHGLIPEAVYQVSSVTNGRSRTFSTPLGSFVFRRVPAQSLYAGAESVEVTGNQWAFIATPLRAVADLVYLNQDITWEGHGMAYLTESLRIEKEDLAMISCADLQEILGSVRNRRVREYLRGLRGALQNADQND